MDSGPQVLFWRLRERGIISELAVDHELVFFALAGGSIAGNTA
jgi:hypothetical protein